MTLLLRCRAVIDNVVDHAMTEHSLSFDFEALMSCVELMHFSLKI